MRVWGNFFEFYLFLGIAKFKYVAGKWCRCLSFPYCVLRYSSSLSTISRQVKMMHHFFFISPFLPPTQCRERSNHFYTFLYIVFKGKVVEPISSQVAFIGHNLKRNLAGDYQNGLQLQMFPGKCCKERQTHGNNCVGRRNDCTGSH